MRGTSNQASTTSTSFSTKSSSVEENVCSTNKNVTRHQIIFHWFRLGDLRLHDNAALVRSCQLATNAQQTTKTNEDKKKNHHNNNNNKHQSPGDEAKNICVHVIPFFYFDCQRIFGSAARTTEFGSMKCSPGRAKFILQSVQDLQTQLQQQGSNLLIGCSNAGLNENSSGYYDNPSAFVSHLMNDIVNTMSEKYKHESNGTDAHCRIDWKIVCQEEVLKEETDEVLAMKSLTDIATTNTAACFQGVEQVWGSTMYEFDDVASVFGGTDLVDLPDSFTPFRNKIEKSCQIERPLPIPSKQLAQFYPKRKDQFQDEAVRSVLGSHHCQITSLQELGYTDEMVRETATVDARGVMEFVGGSTAAEQRIKDYIWDLDLLKIYFDTRNGMLGPNYSTKLSPWLAHGCISPRFIAQECCRYEKERGIQNKSTYWLVFELLWRDYCKLFCTKHGNRIFYPNGIVHSRREQQQRNNKQKSKKSVQEQRQQSALSSWNVDPTTLTAWKEGKTGYPLVDANMRELKSTGFMSNRGRQNVCSFLALDLQQDWRYGADYFETQLLDYDVYSNWYNWCAGAGMTGGRINRFNIVKQSKDYDQHGEYVKHWLPELKDVPAEYVHEPWKMTQFQQREYGVQLGVDYPHRLPTAKPPGGPFNKKPSGTEVGEKERKRNHNNRHQKYEMKSLKEAQINMKNPF